MKPARSPAPATPTPPMPRWTTAAMLAALASGVAAGLWLRRKR